MPSSSDRPLRVLLADDHADSREMYEQFLVLEGFEVHLAMDGAEALARTMEIRPDVVVLDVSMPVLTGLEICQRMKADPRTAATTVILLTGRTEPEWIVQARDAGCDAFLPKPCLPENLVRAVRRLTAPGAVSDSSRP